MEEVFQWSLLQSHKITDEEFESCSKVLRGELEAGEQELWKVFQQVALYQKQNEENKAPSKKSKDLLKVDILAGPFEGESFSLRPTAKTPCPVGRSRNKTFRTKGVSLHKDLEVSTTHGRFELNAAGKVCFTDLSSTNGSFINGENQLDPDVPFELETGMEITCGQTIMKITLL